MSRLPQALSVLRLELAELLGCWLQELRECGEWLLGLVPLRSPRLIVRLEPSQARVYVPRGPQERELFGFPRTPGEPWPEPDAQVLAQAGRGTRVTLVLSPQDVLQHDLTLPEAAQAQLSEVLQLKLERELPTALSGLCVDHRIRGRLKDQRQMLVRVILAHRAPLERLQGQLTHWGWQLTRVGVADEDRPGKVVGNLLPVHRRSRWVPTGQDRRLLVLAGALLGVWMLTILGQWAYERRLVNEELRQLQSAAGQVRQLRARLVRDLGPARALLAEEQRPDAADALVMLTDAIPRDAWVSALEVTASSDSAQLRASIYTPVATQLADHLAQTPRFTAVRLLSARSAGVVSGDRLELSATLQAPSGTRGQEPVR